MKFITSTLVIVAVVACNTVVLAFDAGQMLCMVNGERASRGLSNLGLDSRLTSVAQQHSDYQAEDQTLTHNDPAGDPGTRVQNAGYMWTSVAENIAEGQNSMQSCMDALMASPGHRANILGPSYTHFGAAVSDTGSVPYYTQDFAGDGQQHNFPQCPDGSGDDDDDDDGSSGGSDSGGGGDVVTYSDDSGDGDDSGNGGWTTWTDSGDGNIIYSGGDDSGDGDTITSGDDGDDDGGETITWTTTWSN